MSLKLGFTSNSPPFFLVVRLCLERLSVLPSQLSSPAPLSPYTYNMSVPAIPSHLTGYAHCWHLVPLSSIQSNTAFILPPVSTLSLPEITENTLGSFWIEHTLKGNIWNTSWASRWYFPIFMLELHKFSFNNIRTWLIGFKRQYWMLFEMCGW